MAKRFEYKTDTFLKKPGETFVEWLNKQGADGWELVQWHYDVDMRQFDCTFKRELRSIDKEETEL